jgi:hypothetical protein
MLMRVHFAAVLLLLSPAAHAALGEPDSTVEDDRRALSGVIRHSTNQGTYVVYEITTTGRTLREYVNLSGTVFAIAWQGVSHPDLTGLLGRYYGEFEQGAHSQAPSERRRQSHQLIQTQGAVVARFGHMRAFRGKAYLPALLPEGVSLDEIR